MNTAHATVLPAEHEIPASHDARLTHTASWTRQLGIVWAVSTAFAVFSGAYIAAIIELVFAVLLIRAASDLRAIVQTQGNDLALLRSATARIARMLQVRIVLVLLATPVMLFGMAAYWLKP